MPRFMINKHYGRMTPSLSISIHNGLDPMVSALALITAPVTQDLVDSLRAAAKDASEALEAYEASRERVA